MSESQGMSASPSQWPRALFTVALLWAMGLLNSSSLQLLQRLASIARNP